LKRLPKRWNNFRSVGVAHILAVSGLPYRHYLSVCFVFIETVSGEERGRRPVLIVIGLCWLFMSYLGGA
jgi:predicted membrane metal-binding protein